MHGGVTFSNNEHEQLPRGWWWVGFDCAHAGDVIPAMEAISAKIVADRPDLAWMSKVEHYPAVYRTEAFVRSECESLAEQAHQVEIPCGD